MVLCQSVEKRAQSRWDDQKRLPGKKYMVPPAMCFFN